MYQLIEMTEFFYVRSYGDDSEEVVQALCLRLGEYSIDSLVKVNAMLSNLSKCELTADGLNRKRLFLKAQFMRNFLGGKCRVRIHHLLTMTKPSISLPA